MDALQTSSCESDPKQVLIFEEGQQINYRNDSHSGRMLKDLHSQLKNKVSFDIAFETEGGSTVLGHKNVLMAASPYFQAMFSNFDESNKDLVKIKKLNSTILQLLVDYIYTGQIKITEENVQDLLPAANILQLDFVSGACAKFIEKQLDASNCLGIKGFADLHNCTKLLAKTEAYIKKHFLEIVKGEDFVLLPSEDVVKIISSNDLAVPFEEKVFESIIKWIKHDLEQRKDFLPELMEHIRLPLLVPTPDIFNNVLEEPLLKNSRKCKNYIFEAFVFNPYKSVQHLTIPQLIRCTNRQFGGSQKVILTFAQSETFPKCSTEWYDPVTKLRKNAPEMNDCRLTAGIGVIRDQFVFIVGGVNNLSSQSVSMLDVSSRSPSWVPIVDMLVSRHELGVGVLDNCVYAVGGSDGTNALNSVEVFYPINQEWEMVSSMSIRRIRVGVGVVNNLLYAIGGYDGVSFLKSVECYDPLLDKWTSAAEMSVARDGVGIGVMNGAIYAIGGYNGFKFLKTVEVYKNGVWSTVAKMHLCRNRPGVVAFNGLLYVFGGETVNSIVDTVQIYNPKTNRWAIEILERSGEEKFFYAVAVDRPPHFISN